MREDKTKDRDGSYGFRLCQKQKKMIHDGLYRCCLCWKIKKKNATDSMGAIYVRTKQET